MSRNGWLAPALAALHFTHCARAGAPATLPVVAPSTNGAAAMQGPSVDGGVDPAVEALRTLSSATPPRPDPASAPATPSPEELAAQIGTLHAPVVRVGEDSYAVFGTPQVAHSLWRVAPEPRVFLGWPPAVRVIAHGDHEGRPCFLVESLRFFTRPAGLRGVVCASEYTYVAPAYVTSLDELGALPPTDISVEANSTRGEIFQRAMASGAALGRETAPSGAVFARIWEGQLIDPIERFTAETAPRARSLPAMLRVLRDGARVLREGDDPIAGRFASFRQVGPRVMLGAVFAEVEPRRPDTHAAPRAVPSIPADAEFERRVRSVAGPRMRVLGRASTAAQGSVAVAVDGERAALLLEEEGTLHAVHGLPDGGALAESEVRFADFDGDGRTDVLVWARARVPHAQVFLTGRATDRVAEGRGYSLATLASQSADGAVSAALAAPVGRVTASDVCALVRGARTAAARQRVLAADARVVHFEGEPLDARTAEESEWQSFGDSCASLVCDARLSFCVMGLSDLGHPRGSPGDYLFAREGGALRLRAYANYR